ncbi:MAG: apolipoprotein N-acyltransferase, partial [Niabella sp.]|nr:apolipoprotein N-acyltransferase [Niabella sp.]
MSATKYTGLIRSVIAGLLLWVAWPTSPLTLLIFVAWVPLLFVAETTDSWKKFFGYTYVTMLLWNVLITCWVAEASVPGGVGAF